MKNILKIFFMMLALCGVCLKSSFGGNLPSILIFHINGVNTSQVNAQQNRISLQNLASITSNIVSWDLLYNPTHGLLASDLWDVMRMKKQESKNLTVDDYVKTYMKSYHLNYPPESTEYKKLKNEIKQKYIDDPSIVGKNLKEIIDQFHQKVPLQYASIVKLLRQYKTTLNNNAYVLLLPHSQGNQYANQLWDYVVNFDNFPKSHLAIFGIASPTDNLRGVVKPPNQSNYYTAENDYVINSLSFMSTLIPETNKPMESNLHLYQCDDLLCHNLIGSYLSDPESKYRISNRIASFVIALKKNMLEEQLDKSIYSLFWMNPQFASVAIIRSGRGNVICAEGRCNDTLINYLETSLPELDMYNGYRWTSNLMPDTYMVLFARYGFLRNAINLNDYFFIRGSNILKAHDFAFDECKYTKRDRRQIEMAPSSPFFGKFFASIATEVSQICPETEYPEEMLVDGGTKILLGEMILL